MNETWIDDFLALAETQNFSRAAERRNITQPAFGRRIRAFENWCGQPLFDRSSHRLELTAAGKLVLETARDMRGRISRLHRDLASLVARETALTFAATQALSFTFFPSWINRHAGGVAINLLADNMQACERMMEAGAAQFLLCHTHPGMTLDLSVDRYQARMIGSDRLVPVSALRAGTVLHQLGGQKTRILSFDTRSGLAGC